MRAALRFPLHQGADGATAAAAPPSAVPAPEHADHEALTRLFCSELEALGGSARTVHDPKACAADIKDTMQRQSLRSIAVQSSRLALAVGGCLRDCEVLRADELDRSELAAVDCSLLEAGALLAESGSAVIITRGEGDRMLPYLPQTCFIVCEAHNVRAGMNDEALLCIADAAQAGARGEALIMTGPSRTADIEKILVLGAHGPGFVRALIMAQGQPT
ncbi:MAG: LUD domain-containing protein [Candidatus Eremiobacteraeota bacterium]|nr:LUD domain-containing protein [Candidatus Eremiobacteraeota bacterium]